MSFVGDRALGRLRAFSRAAARELVAGRFELCDRIGEGGMGTVWTAVDRVTGREVAVKIVRPEDERAGLRFAREAELLAELAHPSIVRYVAHGATDDGARFIAMERLVGETLAQRLRRGPLSVAESLDLGRRVAVALAAAHARGIVHRDVKPSNLFLVDGSASAVRLLDFGLARGDDELTVTGAGAVVGTPGYMAPEQVRGAKTVGPRADVFGLGCVLFEALTGRPAFSGDETGAVLAKILLEAPPSVRKLRRDVPPNVAALVERMLAKGDERRLDAATVAQALAGLSRERRIAPAVVALAALLAVAGSVAALRLRAPPAGGDIAAATAPADHRSAPSPVAPSSATAAAPRIDANSAETPAAPPPTAVRVPRPPPARAQPAAIGSAPVAAPPQAAIPPRIVDPRDPALADR